MKSILIIGCCILLFGSNSCSTSSPSDLVDVTPLPSIVSYAVNVKPIIDANCVACHGAVPTNGAPMSLHNYDAVRLAVLNRNLILRLNKSESDFLMMPQGGPKLPQNKIAIIELWQAQGLNQ